MSNLETLMGDVEKLADYHLEKLFKPGSGGAPDIEAQLATGRFSEAVEALKMPFHSVEMREGMLIQTAVARVLQAHERYMVRSPYKVTITDTDRKLVARNRHAKIGELAVPEPGTSVGRGELDIVLYDPAAGRIIVIDVKRALRDGAQDRPDLLEACLALRRELEIQGQPSIRIEIIRLAWYPRPTSLASGSTVSMETIDAALGLPIQDIVEAALRRYRMGFDEKLLHLLKTRFGVSDSLAKVIARPPFFAAEEPAYADTPWISKDKLMGIFGPNATPKGRLI